MAFDQDQNPAGFVPAGLVPPGFVPAALGPAGLVPAGLVMIFMRFQNKRPQKDEKHLLNLCHSWHLLKSRGFDHVKICHFCNWKKSKDM